MGIFFYLQLNALNNTISLVVEKERPLLSGIIQIQDLASELDLYLHHQIAGELTQTDQALEIIDKIVARATTLQNETHLRQQEKDHVNTFSGELRKLRVALIYYRNNRMADSASSSSEEIFDIIEEIVPVINNSLSSIVAIIRREISDSDNRVLNGINFTQNSIVFVFSFIIINSLLIILLFNRCLSRNLNNLIKGTDKLGSGDLTWRIKHEFNDDFGKLSNAFNTMAHKLYQSQKQISEQTEKIERLAYYDSLTELPNRVTFLTRLQEEIERASREQEKLAVLFIDLDDFKVVNDVYGHTIGDLLLKQVAERMTQHVRLSDTVARLAGDEFTILLTQQGPSHEGQVDEEGVLGELNRSFTLSTRIIEALSQPFLIEEKSIHITSTIGIAIYPDNGSSAEDILKSADTAMYAAKAEGKNRFKFCSKKVANKMNVLLRTEQDLYGALENDEFVLHYQPQLDIKTGEICGLEALTRWNHPQKGFTLPKDFIPLAEERGIIHEITKWVLTKVCRQQNKWQEADYETVPVMVNISAKDFYQQDLEKLITDILSTANLLPSLLGIEVTEPAIMKDKSNAIETLSRIKKLGIKIALDGFGTGYSSLSYLKLLPLDIVKIDRSFLYNITTNQVNAGITQTIIAMSHILGFKVLAEGIETTEQADFMKEVDCDLVQGYLYNEPLSVEETSHLLQQIK